MLGGKKTYCLQQINVEQVTENRENELSPACWDGVNGGINTAKPLQSSGETPTKHVKLYFRK